MVTISLENIIQWLETGIQTVQPSIILYCLHCQDNLLPKAPILPLVLESLAGTGYAFLEELLLIISYTVSSPYNKYTLLTP